MKNLSSHFNINHYNLSLTLVILKIDQVPPNLNIVIRMTTIETLREPFMIQQLMSTYRIKQLVTSHAPHNSLFSPYCIVHAYFTIIISYVPVIHAILNHA